MVGDLKVVFHVKRPSDTSLAVAAEALGVRLDDAQAARLARFESLLSERAVDLGMIARSDADRLRERHVLDSLRAAAVLRDADREALDIGSGAGLPGIPVAIASSDVTVRLVEPRRARIAFLELAVERLGLENVAVVPATIETVRLRVDVCLARAFAQLPKAWEAAFPRLRPHGRLVYFAGAGSGTESPEVPAGCSAIEVVPAPRGSVIESAGPLVIMTA